MVKTEGGAGMKANKRTEILAITMTKEEKAKIVEASNSVGMTLSAYCRMILLKNSYAEAE